MILPVGALVSPKCAHHLERVLHDTAAQARRDGYALPDEVVELLRDVRHLAGQYRSQVCSDASDADVTGLSDAEAGSSTLTTWEIAAQVGLSRHGAAEALRRGVLAGRKVAGRWVADEVDVIEWMSGRREESA